MENSTEILRRRKIGSLLVGGGTSRSLFDSDGKIKNALGGSIRLRRQGM